MIKKNNKIQENNNLTIFQGKDGSLELKTDLENETFWASQKQIAQIFSVTTQNVTLHLKNIFLSGELVKNSTCKKSLQVQKEGTREVKREIEEYNLDVLISVGYRIDSTTGTDFRIWATKTLKNHITKGFTINKKLLKKNEKLYLKFLEDIKILSQKNNLVSNDQIIELIKTFSSTWFNLESYDKQNFPKSGTKKIGKKIDFKDLAEELYIEVSKLKKNLINKKEATNFFAQEKNSKSLEGILGSIFQSAFGENVYKTIEEKSANLLYFIIKNHPFTDGNKRTGAFSFIWFLQKMNFDFTNKITPETLTILALLIAESNPKDKEKMVGLVLILLKK